MAGQSELPFALVVDDDALVLMDATGILEDAGFRTCEAENVDQAVRMLEQHADDIRLLFTDVQMPGDRDGCDLARETSERWPDIKILVASGAARPETGHLPEGAVFISKPFTAEIIHGCLQELLLESARPSL